MFAIHSIDIERSDNFSYCGTMEYRFPGRVGTLLWTVEWRETPDVLIEFFPGGTFEDIPVIRANQDVLIGGLLDTLAERQGRETLFTGAP